MSEDLNFNDGIQQQTQDVGGNTPAWMAQLPDNLKANETLAKFQNLGELGNSYLEYEGKLSDLNKKLESSIPKLGEDASDTDREAYRKALGIPDSVDNYELEKFELPEGLPQDETLVQKIKDIAHKNNVHPEALNAIYKTYMEHQINSHKEMLSHIDKAKEEARNTLKNIWTGDSYKENVEKAARTFLSSIEKMDIPEGFGGKDGIKKWVEENGLGDDPRFVWYMSELYKVMSDDILIQGFRGQPQEPERTQSGIPMFKFKGMGN